MMRFAAARVEAGPAITTNWGTGRSATDTWPAWMLADGAEGAAGVDGFRGGGGQRWRETGDRGAGAAWTGIASSTTEDGGSGQCIRTGGGRAGLQVCNPIVTSAQWRSRSITQGHRSKQATPGKSTFHQVFMRARKEWNQRGAALAGRRLRRPSYGLHGRPLVAGQHKRSRWVADARNTLAREHLRRRAADGSTNK